MVYFSLLQPFPDAARAVFTLSCFLQTRNVPSLVHPSDTPPLKAWHRLHLALFVNMQFPGINYAPQLVLMRGLVRRRRSSRTSIVPCFPSVDPAVCAKTQLIACVAVKCGRLLTGVILNDSRGSHRVWFGFRHNDSTPEVDRFALSRIYATCRLNCP
jgi:hypothetical protein